MGYRKVAWMLFANSCRCSVGGETMRLSSQSSRVRYSAPFIFILFLFSFFFFPFFFLLGRWCPLYVCSFFVCNTPPTCNHQLQLSLCWAITMHKSQGQTLDKAVINLGPKEACTGLTFVCLSRAERCRLLFLPSTFLSFALRCFGRLLLLLFLADSISVL